MTAADRALVGEATAARGSRTWRRPHTSYEAVLGSVAALLAAAAVWATLDAEFLRYPGWLSVQKADLVLGPVLVGLYWRRARPKSRFGWLLIAYGFLNAVYIAQSFSRPWLFGLGLAWESVIYLGNQVLIITFPTGRADGIATKLVLAASGVAAAFNVWLILMLPQTGAGGAISQCERLCPENGLAFIPNVTRALDLLDPFLLVVLSVAAATVLLLVWRFVSGTEPQRRALAIGTPIALFFLISQIVYLSLSRFHVDNPALVTRMQWTFTGARALIWWGFLFALVAAELFAGRALSRLVVESLRRPRVGELEQMLRRPLGDPSLRLRFWNSRAAAWDGSVEAGPGSVVTVVEQDGRPSAALTHDARLADDPELVSAAGAVATLAAENAELERAWRDAIRALELSRVRVVEAVDEERRRLALDLHDSVQQRLGAIALRLSAAASRVIDDDIRARIDAVGASVSEAIAEVREISHQIYPRSVLQSGLVRAIAAAIQPIPIEHNDVGRHNPLLESALYYTIVEAVQNARKHGGPGVSIRVAVHETDGALRFAVTDDGPGFDPSQAHTGIGLQNLHDRLAALSGDLSITSGPGRTVVSGSVPVDQK